MVETMNEYNERMLDKIISNFNAIYSIYEKNGESIQNINVIQLLHSIKVLADDLSKVSSSLAKDALCKELMKLLDSATQQATALTNIFNQISGKFADVKKALPLSKSEVAKILKMFNFHDYSDADEQIESDFLNNDLCDNTQTNDVVVSTSLLKNKNANYNYFDDGFDAVVSKSNDASKSNEENKSKAATKKPKKRKSTKSQKKTKQV